MEFPPTSLETKKSVKINSHVIHVQHQQTSFTKQGNKVLKWFDCFQVFFCLVNLFSLEQNFVVVKIRHSSLMLKELLLIFTNKPQDVGEES